MMQGPNVKSGVKMVAIDAVVIRADGRREDLGTISFWHRNLWRRLWWAIKQNWR